MPGRVVINGWVRLALSGAHKPTIFLRLLAFSRPLLQKSQPPPPVQVARREQQPQRPRQARLEPQVVPRRVKGRHLDVGVGAGRGLDAQRRRAEVEAEEAEERVGGGARLG